MAKELRKVDKWLELIVGKKWLSIWIEQKIWTELLVLKLKKKRQLERFKKEKGFGDTKQRRSY